MADPAPDATPHDSPASETATIDAPAPPADAPPPAPPVTMIDWERSRLTPAFVRALAKAQREAQTLGKLSRVDAGAQKYNYTNADHMVAEASRVLNDNGIAWVCASSQGKPPGFDLGDTMWEVSEVTTESVLLHAPDEGDDLESVGLLVTVGRTISIGQKGRTPDKADKAAETYLRGFMARDLVALDRAETPKDEDRDAHVDENTSGRRVITRDPSKDSMAHGDPSSARGPSAAEVSRVKDEIGKACNAIREAMKAKGERPPTIPKLLALVLGDDHKLDTHEQALDAVDKLRMHLQQLAEPTGDGDPT